MLYNVLRVESKNADWKIVDVAGVDGTTLEGASINRTDKKTGSPFPNFDLIQESYQFEANPWTNTSGKHYLFPPRPKASGGATGGSKGGFNIAKAQEKKQENIEKTLDRKEDSFKVSGTARDATLILASLIGGNADWGTDWRTEWLKIRDWLWKEYDNVARYEAPPF